MNTKLFSASILVLGMAAFAPAFASDVDVDNNALALLGAAGSADDGSNATGVGHIYDTDVTAVYAPKSETSTKTFTDNSKSAKADDSFNTEVTNKDSFNSLSASLDLDSTKTTNKGSFNSKSYTDNSVDNSQRSKADDSFNTKLESTTSNKDSFNSDDHSKVDNSVDNSKTTKYEDSFNTKSEVSNKDSFNSEVSNKDSFNTSHETSNKDSFNTHNETTSKVEDSFNVKLDNSVTVASKAELVGTNTGNSVVTAIGLVNASAKMEGSANSNWAGLNQVSIVGGANNTTQMNQQVSAHVGTLNLN